MDEIKDIKKSDRIKLLRLKINYEYKKFKSAKNTHDANKHFKKAIDYYDELNTLGVLSLSDKSALGLLKIQYKMLCGLENKK